MYNIHIWVKCTLHRFSRVSGISLWLVLLFLMTFAFAPHNITAQSEVEESGAPVSQIIPMMRFRPAADADSLDDFAPPEAAIIMADTLLEPMQALTLTEPLPLTPTLPIMAETSVTIQGGQAGLVSFGAGEVSVAMEEKAFSSSVTLTFGQSKAPTPAPGESWPSRLLFFQLEARDALSHEPIAQFDQNVRLIVDLRSFGLDATTLGDGDFFLAYRDEEQPAIWHDVPIWMHQTDGLISAEVNHFSVWTAGWRPEVWKPEWNPPAVSEFSGAATYNYGINVPPGRHGLQPSVSLSYSSRGLDGAIHSVGGSVVASGWSLADIYIAREGVEIDFEDENYRLIHPDKFRLVFNGQGHELTPYGSTMGDEVRYYAKDAPGLRIYRYYHADVNAVPNVEGIYWVVQTPDGTHYRLGYTAAAEEWHRFVADGSIQIDGHRGRDTSQEQQHTSAMGWYVDTVTDLYGNQMVYTYNDELGTKYACERADFCSGALEHRHHRVRIAGIAYNFPGRAPLNGDGTIPNNVARLSDPPHNQVPGTLIAFHARGYWDIWGYWNENLMGHIQNILIYHGGNVNTDNPIREYRLESENLTFAPSINDCPERDANYPQTSTTRVLTQIQEWANTDRIPHEQEEGYKLPPVQFIYTLTPLPHYYKSGDSNRPCFSFFYLESVHNGYGGVVRFTYESDGRSVGQYVRYNFHQIEWPDIGFNYVVKSITYEDGRNSPWKTEYAYHQPCYAQWGDNVGSYNSPIKCHISGVEEYGNIAGFLRTTATYKGYDNEILNVQKTEFALVNANQGQLPEIGRPLVQDSLAANGTTVLRRINNAYATTTVDDVGSFTYLQETRNYQYQNGIGSATLSNKTTYEYNTVNQGNAQYGNPTHIREYDSADSTSPYRLTTNHYYPNTTRWLVNKTAVSALYSGDGATLWNATYNYYDGATSPGVAPAQQGRLTRTAKAWPVSCAVVPGGGSGCASARATIEQTFVYDAYGNQTQMKAYTDYGFRTFNSGGGLLLTIFPTQDQQTDILYESGYNLYPIRVTNDLGQQTNFQIYGFNGVGLGGFQLQRGLLKAVVNANSTETRYEYDPFGRLFAIYDNYDFTGFGDTTPLNGNPMIRYRYWDNSWNHTTYWLNPAANQPFAISEHTRPGTYNGNGQNGQLMFKVFTYFDGLGRPIQTQNRGVSIHNSAGVWDAVTLTDYNAQGLTRCTSSTYGKTHVPESHVLAFDTTLTCDQYSPTLSSYDTLGRPIAVTSPGGNTTTFGYGITDQITVDGVNKLSRVQTYDAKGHVTNRFSNSLGQLVLVRDFSGTSSPYTWYSDTRYTYDLLGNLTHVTTSNPNNDQPTSWLRQVVMTYNKIGHKVAMQDPDMGDWFYLYDALGNLTRQTDEMGQVVCFYYDNLNRLLRQVQDDTPATACPTYASAPANGPTHLASYAYDTANAPYGVGQVAQIAWGEIPAINKDTFTYNNFGLVSSQTRTLDGRPYTLSTLTWDSLYRPLTVQTPHDNEIMTITYDHEGENTLTSGSDTLVSNVGYNVRGQMTSLVRGGFTSTYSYYDPTGNIGTGNNDGRLQAIQHGLLYDNLPNFTYQYDRVGNVTSMVTQLVNGVSDSQIFTYDHLHRLESASSIGNITDLPAYIQGHQYDKLGNILGMAGSTYDYAPAQHAHTQPHAVKSITHKSWTDLFAYDGNGNMVSREEAGVTTTQQFDVLNRLIQVEQDNSSGLTRFSYGAGEQRTRTEVVVPSQTRKVTYYPFPNYEEELLQSWQPCTNDCDEGDRGVWVTDAFIKRSTYRLAGQTIATRVSGEPQGNNGLFYIVTDHLGSTTLLTNSSGAPVANSAAYYLPFGDYRKAPTSDLRNVSKLGFTGHQENRELGLTYMNARFYLPGIGRFASADTIVPGAENPQAYNRYSYTLNNPILLTDPSGHAQCQSLEGTCYAEEATPITQTEYEDAIIRQHKEANKTGTYSQTPASDKFPEDGVGFWSPPDTSWDVYGMWVDTTGLLGTGVEIHTGTKVGDIGYLLDAVDVYIDVNEYLSNDAAIIEAVRDGKITFDQALYLSAKNGGTVIFNVGSTIVMAYAASPMTVQAIYSGGEFYAEQVIGYGPADLAGDMFATFVWISYQNGTGVPLLEQTFDPFTNTPVLPTILPFLN